MGQLGNAKEMTQSSQSELHLKAESGDVVEIKNSASNDQMLSMIQSTIEMTLLRLRDVGLLAVNDYTVKDLAKILNISESSARSVTTGRYTVGTSVRYRRSEIDYLRKIGGKINTESNAAR